jgi:hypothetical protein
MNRYDDSTWRCLEGSVSGILGFLLVGPKSSRTVGKLYGFLFSNRGAPDNRECGCDYVGAVDACRGLSSSSCLGLSRAGSGVIGFEPTERRGNQWRGPCPIHGSMSAKSRSFSVHLGKNAFRCFRCGAAGNQLDLWTKVSRTDLHTATLALCHRLGLDIPCLPSSPRPQGTGPRPRSEKRNP